MNDFAATAQADPAATDSYGSLLHEVRGPVASIQSYVRTLMTRDATLSPVARATMYQVVLQQSVRLDAFVDDIVLYLRLVEGALPIDPEPVLVASVVEEVRQRLGEPDRVIVGTGMDRLVTADRAALAHAVRRLMRNALVYGPRRASITVSATADSGTTTIWVADTGPGIPEQVRGRAQQAFIRAVRPDERRSDGIGLGLTVAREIALLLGGSLVLADNNPGLKAGIRLPD